MENVCFDLNVFALSSYKVTACKGDARNSKSVVVFRFVKSTVLLFFIKYSWLARTSYHVISKFRSIKKRIQNVYGIVESLKQTTHLGQILKHQIISFKSYTRTSCSHVGVPLVHQHGGQNFKVIITQKLSSQKIVFTISYIISAY